MPFFCLSLEIKYFSIFLSLRFLIRHESITTFLDWRRNAFCKLFSTLFILAPSGDSNTHPPYKQSHAWARSAQYSQRLLVPMHYASLMVVYCRRQAQ